MTTQPTDLYAVLGLVSDATQDQISRAYRAMLRRHHPDTRAAGDRSQNAASDAALQRVIAAYTVLHNPGRRAAYDQLHATGSPPSVGQAWPIFVSRTGPVDEPPLRSGPVRWHPSPPPNHGGDGRVPSAEL